MYKFQPFSQGRSKYGNKKVGAHASKKEHYRAAQLNLMQRAGLISDLREQVSYQLIPPQYEHIEGRKPKLIERACSYIADFVYTDNDGNTIVEDTKGFRTPEYIIKRKLMLQVHGIRIREI
jgi:hypothetical protein